MKRLLTGSLALLALAATTPAQAQDAERAPKVQSAEGRSMEQFAALMGGLFKTEPLNAEQQARLPAAKGVVGAMLPAGFYGKMMGDIMDKMMRPMMTGMSKPEVVLGSRVALSQEQIERLGAEKAGEAMRMLDPAHDRRVDAIIGVMSGKMTGMFAQLEGPMREGLSKAYAVRFDERQLADIGAFFATPTGSLYARESMALFADPQVMQANMQALPAMLGGFGDLESAMTQAMAALPKERDYKDLSTAERTRLAEILGVPAARLPSLVKPAKPAGQSRSGQK